MRKELLLLPVGGSASRMQGLPKFMLPVSDRETLIERHCRGAIEAGYDEIHIVARSKYKALLEDYLFEKNILVNVHSLSRETSTMSETLKLGTDLIHGAQDAAITVGLSDTAFRGASYESIYGALLNCPADYVLGLFGIRDDQFGRLGQVDLDSTGRVISMQDKSFDCRFSAVWGLAKVPGEMISGLDIADAHIGIGIEKLVSAGQSVLGILNKASYYDCGTFSEYSMFINHQSSDYPSQQLS